MISKRPKPILVHSIPFSRFQLGSNEFSFKETVRYFVLHDDKNHRFFRIPKDVDEDEEEDAGEAEIEEREYTHGGKREQTISYPGRPASYGTWPSYFQESWDRQTLEFEEARQWRNEQKELLELFIFQQERYFNNLFEYTEQVRHHEDYRAKLPYTENYFHEDYRTRPFYDVRNAENVPFPSYPQMKHPNWWPRPVLNRVYHPEEGSSSTQATHVRPPNPFETRSYGRCIYESLFGPRHGSH